MATFNNLILNCEHWLNAPNINFYNATYCFNVINFLNNRFVEFYRYYSDIRGSWKDGIGKERQSVHGRTVEDGPAGRQEDLGAEWTVESDVSLPHSVRGESCVYLVLAQPYSAQSTVDFPIGGHVNVLSDYKETGPEKNSKF